MSTAPVNGDQPPAQNAAAPQVPNANEPADDDCAVCGNTMCIPTAVPQCGHQFCFTCIKGVHLSQSPACPICRGVIDGGIFESAQQLNLKMKTPGEPEPDFTVRRFVNNTGEEIEEMKPDVEVLQAQMRAEAARTFWLYEGRNGGWWRFEPRNEKELEDAFQAGVHQEINMMVVGRMYTFNFANMEQYPRGSQQFARRIKRVDQQEFDALNVKGLAGAFVARD